MKYRWRDAIKSARGPADATLHSILLVLADWMQVDGTRCDPTVAQLAAQLPFLQERALRYRLQQLDGVWFRRRRVGRGYVYRPRIPGPGEELPTLEAVRDGTDQAEETPARSVPVLQLATPAPRVPVLGPTPARRVPENTGTQGAGTTVVTDLPTTGARPDAPGQEARPGGAPDGAQLPLGRKGSSLQVQDGGGGLDLTTALRRALREGDRERGDDILTLIREAK